MKRFTINAMIAVDVNGDDEVDAYEHFVDAMGGAADHGEGIRDITVQHSETKPVPFVVPRGGERWGDAAEVIRFGEDRYRFQKDPPCPMYDGAWWWTDGHVALRCSGDPPEGWRRIEDPWKPGDIAKRPMPTGWGPELSSTDGYRATAHVSVRNPEIAIQAKYRRLVEEAIPDVVWRVGEPRQAVLAFQGDTIMALVMPILADRYAEAAPSKGGDR